MADVTRLSRPAPTWPGTGTFTIPQQKCFGAICVPNLSVERTSSMSIFAITQKNALILATTVVKSSGSSKV